MKETREEIVDEIFNILRKHLKGAVEIDYLNAQNDTRADVENLIDKYMGVLNP